MAGNGGPWRVCPEHQGCRPSPKGFLQGHDGGDVSRGPGLPSQASSPGVGGQGSVGFGPNSMNGGASEATVQFAQVEAK